MIFICSQLLKKYYIFLVPFIIIIIKIKRFSINPNINANFGLYVVILHKYNINHANIQYEKTKSNLNDFIIIYEKKYIKIYIKLFY